MQIVVRRVTGSSAEQLGSGREYIDSLWYRGIFAELSAEFPLRILWYAEVVWLARTGIRRRAAPRGVV